MLTGIAGALLLVVVAGAAQQPEVVLRAAGPERPGALLRAALERPYDAFMEPGGAAVALPRDTTVGATVIVLHSDATVGATVHGDVFVVGGDLFIHPGADIHGRAVAIGGGVYGSTLATVRGEQVSFRDVMYDVDTVPGGFALTYRDPAATAQAGASVSLPFVYGFRAPEYTRVDGVVLPWGPQISLGDGVVVLDPVAAYHSDLGTLDPSLTLNWFPRPTVHVEAMAQRGTFSNDRWIRPDLVNSLTTLVAGRDIRNYYRGDRFQALVRLERPLETGSLRFALGASTEDGSSVAAGGPWSFFGRNSARAMDRPNPPVADGRISSVLAGVGGYWEGDELLGEVDLNIEVPFDTPDGSDWVQLTGDAVVSFPTFGLQSFDFHGRAVLTPGDIAPPQRWVYLGGPETIPTLEILEFGGDHLLFVQSSYNVPIPVINVPLFGPPVVSLRHAIGRADIGRLVSFEQNVGAAVGLGPFEVEFMVDPSTGDTDVAFGSRELP